MKYFIKSLVRLFNAHTLFRYLAIVPLLFYIVMTLGLSQANESSVTTYSSDSSANEILANDLLAMVNAVVAKERSIPYISEFKFDTISKDLILLEPFLAQAQGSAQSIEEPQITNDSDKVSLDFQNADILALINTVSSITGKNFIIDPRVKGRVTLVSGSKLNADQVYEVFLSVLDVHNFVAIEQENLTKILPINLAKQRPIRTNTDNETGVDQSDEYITQVYTVKHASAVQLTPMLRPLLPPTSHFVADQNSNTLVFTDTAANINRILRVLDKIDQPESHNQVEIYVVPIEFADARKVASIINQAFQTISTPTQPSSNQQKNPFLAQVDEGLNSLVIQATEEDYLIMRALIEQLDIPREDKGDIHVVYLRYAKATDLAAVISEIASSSASVGEQGTAPTVESTIKADEATNALIIRADETKFAEIKHVIDKLDIRRSQVFVEAIIAEVSETKAADIGVEWGQIKFNSAGEQITAASDFSDSTGGLTLGFLNKYVRDLTGTVVPDLNIVLRMLRSDGNSNIIATPTLLSMDNQPAEIVVGQEVPFVTGSYTSTDSTSGVDSPFQTIERKDVGLTLKITPQISEGDNIRLEIEQEISRLSATTVDGVADLITNKRSIKGTVLADDGQIIVLGGLISEDVGDTIEWVPGLGKIPVIGALFRKKTKDVVRQNLIVFLRPKIIREPSDLFGETKSRYAKLQKKQLESLSDSTKLIKGEDAPVLPKLDEDGKPINAVNPEEYKRKLTTREIWAQKLKRSKPFSNAIKQDESLGGRK